MIPIYEEKQGNFIPVFHAPLELLSYICSLPDDGCRLSPGVIQECKKAAHQLRREMLKKQ